MKVFFNDRVIQFFEHYENDICSDKMFDYCNIYDLQKFIFDFEENRQLKKINISCSDISILWTEFESYFNLLQAAGGFIRRNDNEYLVIRRMGKWDLPKGKMEPGEIPKQTALREVGEETGLRKLKIVKTLQPTYHTYRLRGELMLKKTHWFSMINTDKETLIPQTEEEITEVRWINKSELDDIYKNTYISLLDVFHEGILD